ncbi:MAG: PEP/pyruvate-binding domain-containing protein, partial [Candidatus Thermoplasmatota archaeon]|nr:PEP/pyruvate-binding domain-containing protein [Candidatus Thermoplasmatota archaeon]
NTLADEIVRYSQKKMDVINIEHNSMETVEVGGVLRDYWDQYPLIEQIVSVYKNGTLSMPTGILDDPETSEFATTFQGLFQKGKFLVQIKKVLAALKDAMGTPVDVEFAHDGKNLFILQCRPQSQAPESRAVAVPKKIPVDRKILSASKHVTTSYTPGIEYLVCVDPDGYASLETREDMFRVAAVIRELNSLLPKRKFVLIGPGRWGSRGDIKLGVPVVYGDISNTALLIEVAKERGGYMPDLSFGTHFFQDLVEADIHYLPLYLDQKGFFLNTEMIEKAPNKLSAFLAKHKDMEKVVKLISIKDISGGGVATVVMDGDANRALAYISEPMKLGKPL